MKRTKIVYREKCGMCGGVGTQSSAYVSGYAKTTLCSWCNGIGYILSEMTLDVESMEEVDEVG